MNIRDLDHAADIAERCLCVQCGGSLYKTPSGLTCPDHRTRMVQATKKEIEIAKFAAWVFRLPEACPDSSTQHYSHANGWIVDGGHVLQRSTKFDIQRYPGKWLVTPLDKTQRIAVRGVPERKFPPGRVFARVHYKTKISVYLFRKDTDDSTADSPACEPVAAE